jgi:hypothetical protein
MAMKMTTRMTKPIADVSIEGIVVGRTRFASESREEDRTLRAVLVGMLRDEQRGV